jgi:mRNA-degrading endonuclease toxin of MazEF toxin-antitoxin module
MQCNTRDRREPCSTVQLHRLMTIATSMIQRELGSLSPQMLHETDEKLKKLFGLRNPA